MQHPSKVLIADDEPLNLDMLAQELEFAGYEVLSATSGPETIARAESDSPDLILLDIMMPAMDGYETCERLKSSEKTRGIPVIFMTALADTRDKIRAFELGGLDYITKPFNPVEVLARVATHVANRRLQRELENVIQRSSILSRGPTIEIREALESPKSMESAPGSLGSLEDVERSHIVQVLDATHWVIEGTAGAANMPERAA